MKESICTRRKHLRLTATVVGFGDEDWEAIREFLQFGMDNYDAEDIVRNADFEVIETEACDDEGCQICYPD